MRVRGAATADEAGVVRCYLQDLAHRDTAGLYAIADYIPKPHLTASDLQFATDARSGLATAYFSPSSVSVSYIGVTITYADGAAETTGLLNIQAMGGPSTWRMAIGN